MTRLGFGRADLMAISIGGTLGASLRWFLTRDTKAGDGGWFGYAPNTSPSGRIPLDTLVVNLLGCLVLGALTLLVVRSIPLSRRLLLGAATGFCGSLTTFSTFAVEVAALLRTSPMAAPGPTNLKVSVESEVSTALVYVALSLAGGAACFWLGRAGTHRLVDAVGPSTSDGSE